MTTRSVTANPDQFGTARSAFVKASVDRSYYCWKGLTAPCPRHGYRQRSPLVARRGYMRVNRKNINREANPFAFLFWIIYFFLATAFPFAVPIWRFSH